MLSQQADQNNLIAVFAEHKLQNATIVMGATAAGTPTETAVTVLGNWTSTNGIGLLSYIEIFQIIGATGVLIASINIIVNWVKAYLKSRS